MVGNSFRWRDGLAVIKGQDAHGIEEWFFQQAGAEERGAEDEKE
jgi:hypothetical protein